MHAQSAAFYQHFKKCRAYETAFALKAEGKIKHVGISFHDHAEVLEQILTDYPEIEVVQIQFNYVDYDDPAVKSRKCYEVCRRHGKPVLVMEPVKGGNLVNLPEEARKVLDELHGGSPASYAIRFAAGFPGMMMVLSGMSSMEQMKDNLSYMKDFQPLNETELEMDVNTRKGLKATIVPSNTTDSKILSWESEDPTIALVSATGNVTAKGPGTTTITVRAENGVSASCEVTVNSPITSVRLSQTRMTLEAGTSQQLRAMIEPVDTTDDTTLTWMSTVPSVATVDQEGNVTALREGYAIIRVETVNGSSTTCRVEVVETQEVPITGVSLDQESMTLTEGESGTLNATIIPGDTTDDRTLIWSSDAPEVAVVNDGEVTAIAPGTATLTVTPSNG